MLSHEDDQNIELEKLVAEAKPTLDACSLNQIAYSAGWAASQQDQLHRVPTSGHSRWLLLASHAACAIAAGWMTFALLPSSLTPENSTSTGPLNPPGMAQVESPSSTLDLAVPMSSDGILSPRISPSRLVEYIHGRDEKSPSVSNSDNEPILNSRSIIF